MSGLIKGKEVHFDEEYLHVKLADNRIISTPLDWYEPLKKATISQLKDYKLILCFFQNGYSCIFYQI